MWNPPADRPDPIALLQLGDADRLTELVPIRYGRMAQSPFAFFRGAAAIMASDLQFTPRSGIVTQICGDAHLMNFGAYASPERRFVFDVNDFDETVAAGAWEWDLKRLVAGVAIAARSIDARSTDADAAVRRCVRTYRERMREFAAMRVLDVWYARIDERVLAEAVGDAQPSGAVLAEPSLNAEHLFPKLCAIENGALRLVDHSPLIFHPDDDLDFEPAVRDALARYRRSLPADRRALFGRYAFVDAAYKVVGVGSVGTRCSVALLVANGDDVMFLQVKEARASVYESYVPKSPFAAHGERVVTGQRLMQATTDLFLGWARGEGGRSFYVRQLRDLKTSADVATMSAAALGRYAAVCGWALARAHAKAGGVAAAIAGYLGSGDAFDDALVAFARAYADQNDRDFEELGRAVASGRIALAPSASK